MRLCWDALGEKTGSAANQSRLHRWCGGRRCYRLRSDGWLYGCNSGYRHSNYSRRDRSRFRSSLRDTSWNLGLSIVAETESVSHAERFARSLHSRRLDILPIKIQATELHANLLQWCTKVPARHDDGLVGLELVPVSSGSRARVRRWCGGLDWSWRLDSLKLRDLGLQLRRNRRQDGLLYGLRLGRCEHLLLFWLDLLHQCRLWFGLLGWLFVPGWRLHGRWFLPSLRHRLWLKLCSG